MAAEILLFGGSGKLGSAILEIQPNIIAPNHKQCDITDFRQVFRVMGENPTDIVINSAALVGTRECEYNKSLAWKTNVEGAKNIAKVCRETNTRYVYISSAAVFDGIKGNYSEQDEPSPTFYYAVTKVAAEQSISMLENFAIARLDFFSAQALKYSKILVDHFTSKISVDEAARKIIQLATSGFVGIMNIGQERQSLYNILKPYFPNIEPIKLVDSSLPNFPRDISLDLSLWNEKFGK